MKRWIVEGIRHGGERWETKVDVVEAPNRALALAQASRDGRMRGYDVAVRIAAAEDKPEHLRQDLSSAMQDASRELDRLVNETALEMELERQLEQETGSHPGRVMGEI